MKLLSEKPPDPLINQETTQTTRLRTFWSALKSHSTDISSDLMSWDTDSSYLYIDNCVTRGIISHISNFFPDIFQNCKPEPYDDSSGLLMKIGEGTRSFKFTDDSGEFLIWKILDMAYVPIASYRLASPNIVADTYPVLTPVLLARD